MALYDKEGRFESGGQRAAWHVGETYKPIDCRVVSFQADGDELDVIIAALKATVKPVKKLDKCVDMLKEAKPMTLAQVIIEAFKYQYNAQTPFSVDTEAFESFVLNKLTTCFDGNVNNHTHYDLLDAVKDELNEQLKPNLNYVVDLVIAGLNSEWRNRKIPGLLKDYALTKLPELRSKDLAFNKLLEERIKAL